MVESKAKHVAGAPHERAEKALKYKQNHEMIIVQKAKAAILWVIRKYLSLPIRYH